MIAMTDKCEGRQTRSTAAKRKRQRPRLAASELRCIKHFTPLLNAEEERELAARIKRGDNEARDELIVANFGLVIHFAQRYQCSGATVDDLIQEGMRGLIRAAQEYDPQPHNARFSTYASYWIRNKIQRAVIANSSLIRLPDYIFRVRARFGRTLAQVKAGDLSLETALIELSKRRYRYLLRTMITRSPFLLVDKEGEETSLGACVIDPYEPEREVERQETIELVQHALDRLSPIEAWIIRRRFGIVDPSGSAEGTVPTDGNGRRRPHLSFREVARIFGISPRQARQIEESALRKLKEYLSSHVAPDGVLET